MTISSPFRHRLEEALGARHSRLNPFTEKWRNGELTRAHLGGWVSQHVLYVSQFSRWCATMYGGCSDREARDFLLENIIEEESGTKHIDLLFRFAEACGLSAADLARSRQLPSTRALTAWCYETARQPFHVAAAGLLVGLESQVPEIYRRNIPALREAYGFSEFEIEYFTVHVETDEVHGERGYQIVERHATTASTQAEAIEAVREAAEMRWQYMTGVYRAYVLEEEA